jgi:methyl-accepting chemotaxis protein
MDTYRSQSSASATYLTSSEDLLDTLLTASSLEQAGRLEDASILYQEVLAADPDGTYGISARKALAAMGKLPAAELTGSDLLPQVTSRFNDETAAPTPAAPVVIDVPVVQRFHPFRWIQRRWQNLRFASKLTILLVTGAILPVVLATQGLVWVTQNNVQKNFQDKLRSDAAAWQEEYLLWVQRESQIEAENLARLVGSSGIQVDSPQQAVSGRIKLNALMLDAISANDVISPEMTKSLRVVTDAKGNSIVQYVQIHLDAVRYRETYPPVPAADRLVSFKEFQVVTTRPGITLGKLPIVRAVLQTGQPLKGVEVLPADVIQQLGLAPQATVPLRFTANPSPTEQPAPPNTYDVQNYQVGLVSMAVHPIKRDDRVVGAVVVGTLLNRNHAILDYFQQVYGTPLASVYAYNWRVNTNAPASDQTRAFGILAPEQVSEPVLEGSRELSRVEQIAGVNYVTIYRPLYDHRKQLTPNQAKPVGMLAVARPKTELERLLVQQQVLGLAIGGGMLLLLIAVAIPVAKAFSRSLQSLAQFAQQVGEGATTIRLESTDRQDEIGILSRELNQMVANITTSIAAVQRQEELRRQEADQQRQEKEKLQRGVMNLLLEIEGAQQGDLTVHAPVTEGSIGSIADAFNATIRSLRNLVSQVQATSGQVSTLVQASTPSMQKLSHDATVQAEEIHHALVTVSQISDSIQEVAQSAEEAATIAQQAATAAQDGGDVMDATVAAITNVRSAVDETAKRVERLTDSFQRISQILVTISGISERTNLLAYNASIEASRAGENGQGFRVVAEEVRRLAQRVTDATRTIEQIVETIQQDTADVRQAMTLGTTEVAIGTELVDKTQNTLRGLVDLSQRIDYYLQSISQSTQTQAQASQQVNQLMAQVAAITQNTTMEAQSVATSLQELAQVAYSLQASVSQFRLNP